MALTDKLSAIGDAIRVQSGKTEKLTLAQMPTEIINLQSLNFEVVGNPKPENPKENTIWVDTDKANPEWIFSADEPSGMRAEKQVNGSVVDMDDASDSGLRYLTLYGKTIQNGTPTPDAPVPLESPGNDGTLTVKVGISATDGNPQTMTVQTPNGLPGIPVSSEGNYIDKNGQMWVCDEIDFARGKYVQRIKTLVLNGSESWYKVTMNAPYVVDTHGIADCTQNEINILCDNYQPVPTSASWVAYDTMVSRASESVQQLYFRNVNYTTLDAFKASLADSPIKLQCILAEPIESDLTTEVMAQYSALHTCSPNTTIYNEGADMKVGYHTLGLNEDVVWIKTGTTSSVEFNALKKNGIYVHPLTATQSVDGKLVKKNAEIYQGGKWVDLWDGTIYYYGGFYEQITGGWENWGCTVTPTVTYAKNYIEIKATGTSGKMCAHRVVNTFDLSGVTSITAEIQSNKYNRCSLFVKHATTGVQSYVRATTNDKTTVTLDTSALSGEHIIMGRIDWSESETFWMRIYSIKLNFD